MTRITYSLRQTTWEKKKQKKIKNCPIIAQHNRLTLKGNKAYEMWRELALLWSIDADNPDVFDDLITVHDERFATAFHGSDFSSLWKRT